MINFRCSYITKHYPKNEIGKYKMQMEKVDLISFDMVIQIKVIKLECTTDHSYIFSYCYSFLTS